MAQAGGNGGPPQPPPPPGGDDLPAAGENVNEEEEEVDLDQLDQTALLRMFVQNQQAQTRLMQALQGEAERDGICLRERL